MVPNAPEPRHTNRTLPSSRLFVFLLGWVVLVLLRLALILIRHQQVGGSTPLAGSRCFKAFFSVVTRKTDCEGLLAEAACGLGNRFPAAGQGLEGIARRMGLSHGGVSRRIHAVAERLTTDRQLLCRVDLALSVKVKA